MLIAGVPLSGNPRPQVALAPSFRLEPRNPQQGLGLAEERHAQIYAHDKHIGRTEFCRNAVCPPVVGVVERAAVPVVESSGLQPLKNGQAAQRALSAQPPDREDNKDQPEYATDSDYNGSG
jgi:hypothetical protein